jgi:chorismate-pyruvate lyase
MFAKTVLPLSTLKELSGLRFSPTTPIGYYLFQSARWRRSEFHFQLLFPGHQDYPKQCGWVDPCWARRSVFRRGSSRLLLTEVFNVSIN